jgi:hypothetical protein
MLLLYIVQGQQTAWRTVIEQQREAFAVAEAALQTALQESIANGRAVRDLHRGKVLQPAEVLRALQAPVGMAAAASSDANVRSFSP